MSDQTTEHREKHARKEPPFRRSKTIIFINASWDPDGHYIPGQNNALVCRVEQVHEIKEEIRLGKIKDEERQFHLAESGSSGFSWVDEELGVPFVDESPGSEVSLAEIKDGENILIKYDGHFVKSKHLRNAPDMGEASFFEFKAINGEKGRMIVCQEDLEKNGVALFRVEDKSSPVQPE